MDSKLKEEDAMWHKNSSLCGPHNLHVSPCSISTSIFSCIYLISYIIKYLSHSNFWTSFISSLKKIQNVSIQPRELVGLIELSCYAVINMGTLQCLAKQSHFTYILQLDSPFFTGRGVTERNSYGLGYHNRQLNSRNQSFPICKRNRQLTLKDLDSYLIPDGWCRSPLSFPTSAWIDELLPQHSINKTSILYIIVLALL